MLSGQFPGSIQTASSTNRLLTRTAPKLTLASKRRLSCQSRARKQAVISEPRVIYGAKARTSPRSPFPHSRDGMRRLVAESREALSYRQQRTLRARTCRGTLILNQRRRPAMNKNSKQQQTKQQQTASKPQTPFEQQLETERNRRRGRSRHRRQTQLCASRRPRRRVAPRSQDLRQSRHHREIFPLLAAAASGARERRANELDPPPDRRVGPLDL